MTGMITDTAAHAPLAAIHAISPDERASAERWRLWQQKNADTGRRDAKRMRIVFTTLFVALGGWLAIQLFAPSLVP